MQHLLDKVPVSELCEELGLRPTVFYRWQKELFESRQTTASESPPASRVKSEVASHRDVGQARKAILPPSR